MINIIIYHSIYIYLHFKIDLALISVIFEDVFQLILLLFFLMIRTDL